VASWQAASSDHRPELHVSFLGGKPAQFHRVVFDNPAGVQDIELLSDGSTSLGRFRLEARPGPQAFPLPATTARSLTVRLLSVYEGKSFGMGEVAIEEVPDANPKLPQRLASALGHGFTDEFAAGRLTFWEQTDFLAGDTPATWLVRDGKLFQPRSERGGDHRTTALLHAAPITGNFRLQATVHGSARAAGLVFGFRDWENFDRLLVLEGQSQVHGGIEINSLRLERWREGRPRVLRVHGESASPNLPLRLEVIRQGTRLAVMLQDRVIFNLDDDQETLPGRAGLFTSDSHGMTFHQVRLSPLTAPVNLAAINPLSYADGASIVWLSGQMTGREGSGWAYHLLRNPVLAPGGSWEVTPTNGKPPEIVFAFRDTAEVNLEAIGFQLPASTGTDARDGVRRIEVLVTRETPLDPSGFRTVGTFDLAPRPGEQSFPLPQPVTCRYVMLRLLANGGGSKYTLAGVSARLGVTPVPSARTVAADRGQVEQNFAKPPGMVEKEPNDQPGQATTLINGKTAEATIQPGETDLFTLPPPPAGRGRATLRLNLAALPWMRLNADVLDEAGSVLSPPFARVSTGQLVQQGRPSQPTPRFVKVQKPDSALSFVMDNSGSMGGREDDVRAAVQHFLEGVATTEEVEVLRFESKVVPLVPFTRDQAKLAVVPKHVHMSGNTALYQAILKAMSGLIGRSGSRAIVLLSDGMNTVPGPDFAEVCRRLREQPVPVYVIGVGWDLFEYDAASGNTCHDLLRNLALATGGRFFFAPTSDQLDALYREIAAELRGATRYRLRAEWEVIDRRPELLTWRRAIAPKPLVGSLPPAAPDLAEVHAPPSAGPLRAGKLPAPVELAETAIPTRVVQPQALSLPGASELTESKTPPVGPARSSLPGAVELSTPSPPAVALSPGALPEYGRLELSYRPPGAAGKLPTLPTAVRPSFLLILDSSGSMAQPIGGEKKFLAARRVLHDLLRALPDDAIVGLRMFGISLFWKRGQEPQPDADDQRYNTDSDLVVRVGQLDTTQRQEMRKWIDWAAPTGGTPLCYSLIQGLKDFPADRPGPRTVVLVSDGMESQGGKLEEVARAYGAADVGLVIHVVGFDVGKSEEQTQLQALARIGRGNYYHAADAKQLADALHQALHSARYVVHDVQGKDVITRGDINGAPLDLPAGDYRITIPGTKVESLRVRINANSHRRVALDDQGKMTIPE
jgi:Mg-chelatase subunit ChlD